MNRLYIKVSILLTLLFVSWTPLMANSTKNLNFIRLDSSDGLSQNEVYCFLEDSRGYMWIGTLDGLNLYDGNKIEHFYPNRNDQHALPNNTIYSLEEDYLQRVWVGTDNGLAVYNIETETIDNIINQTSFGHKICIKCIQLCGSTMYVGTDTALYSFDASEKDPLKLRESMKYIEVGNDNSSIIQIQIDKSESVWLLNDVELYKIDSTDGSIVKVLNSEDITSNVLFRDFSIDTEDRLWITTYNHGAFVYDHLKGKITKIKTGGNPTKSISSLQTAYTTSDDKGNVYISTQTMGLNIVTPNNNADGELEYSVTQVKSKSHSEFSLSSNMMHNIYVSSNNTIWVATVGSGVCIYSPDNKPFAHYKITTSQLAEGNPNFIRSICVDSNGVKWIGTHNNGLFTLNNCGEPFTYKGFSDMIIHNILEIDSTHMLLATGTGTYMVTKNRDQIIESHIINEQSSVYLVNSKKNIFWIATYNGLCRVDASNPHNIKSEMYDNRSEIKLAAINCRTILYRPIKNELWVGTEGGGINVIRLDNQHRPTSVYTYRMGSDNNTLNSDYIRTIVKDNSGNIWVGSYGGLNKCIFNGDSVVFQSFTQEDGLASNMVQFIEVDKANRLWIGTNNGLSQYDTTTNTFKNFTYQDGLQGKEFAEHASDQDENEYIYAGGLNGINIFDPNSIKESCFDPRVAITGLQIFDKEVTPSLDLKDGVINTTISLAKSVKLAPDQNSISLHFSAFSYINPMQIKYEYKLEGYDTKWYTTHHPYTFARYHNLPFGKYKFIVRATNIESENRTDSQSIDIEIRTPLLHSKLAYFIYFLILLMIIIYFTRHSVVKIADLKEIERKKQLGKKIAELDYMRSRFFINIAHDLLTPITLICNPLEDTLKVRGLSYEARRAMTIANNNAKRLRYLIEQMLDIRKSEFGKHQLLVQEINLRELLNDVIKLFQYSSQRNTTKITLDYQLDSDLALVDSDKISKIMFNLISNSYKYTNNGEITIFVGSSMGGSLPENLSNEIDYIRIDVIDTGSGIHPDILPNIFERYYYDKRGGGSGIGLSHTKELLEVHKGGIIATSELGKGTSISVFIPNNLVENTDIMGSEQSITFHQSLPTANTNISTINEPKDENQSNTTLLIIDDNDDLREYIYGIFSSEYNIIQAMSGEMAIEMIEKEALPDIILCDVMMSGISGIEFCSQIKSNANTRHIPIIMLTAKTADGAAAEGFKAGADDYITKPFNSDILKMKVHNLLKTIQCSRKVEMNEIELNPPAIAVTSDDVRFLNKLMNILETNLADPTISVNDIEQKFNMSHATFYRKMKETTGMSCKEFLQTMRIKKAHQIIEADRSLRVSDVAYMVGFTDPKYFSKCFKKEYSKTPTDI